MREGAIGASSVAAVALAVTMVATPAGADCTKDIECKGDRICEQGRCVAPTTRPESVTLPVAVADEAGRPAHAPLSFGIGLDVGPAFVFPERSSAIPGFDWRLDEELSSGHYGVLLGFRMVNGSETLMGVDLLFRYYLFDASSSPFLSVGLMPLLVAFTPSQGQTTNGGVSGTALSFELGEELLRTSKKIGLRFKARVDVPFFALKDDSGQTHGFWGASLVAGVELPEGGR